MKCQHLLLMNKITAIKGARNGSDFALWAFSNMWSTFIEYWKVVRPEDNVTNRILEML